MKFIKLEILNLASLDRQGGETIHFEEGALGDSTIFSIVGPTGSGKSTILDAICLALYNRAPRYPRKRGDRGQNIEIFGEPEEGEKNRLAPTDSRNILTRGKKEGYCKLTFLANNGDVYRAEWSVRKLTKNYENAHLSLYKITQTGDGWTEEPAEWDQLPQIIGLDYEQFLRTVLIAQGSFANFLTAKENERYELLEKLIGCEDMYIRIADKIKQQKDAATKAYEQIAAHFQAQEKDLIPEQEIVIVRQRIDELEAIEKKTKEELLRVTEAIAWYTADEKHTENIGRYETHFQKAQTERESLHELTERLALHDATLPAVALYKEIKTAEANIQNGTRSLEQMSESMHKHMYALRVEEEGLTLLRQDAEKATHELELQKPHINKAREIKAQLQPLMTALAEKRIKDQPLDLSTAESLYEIKREELETRNAQHRKELESEQMKAERIERDEAALQTLREARTLLISKDITAVRRSLKKGQPCPVCGATDHPYDNEQTYHKVTTELDAVIQEQEGQLRRRKERVETLRRELSPEDTLYIYVELLKIAKEVAAKQVMLQQEMGDKDPDVYERALTEAKYRADKAVNDRIEAVGRRREQLKELRGKEMATKEQIANESGTLEYKQQALTLWLADYNTQHAALTEQDIALLYKATDNWEAIRQHQRLVSEAYTSAETTLNNERKAHQEHQQKRPQEEKDALLHRKAELESLSHTELVDTKARLQRHETAMQQMGAMYSQKQEAETLKQEWEQIADAIGGDGKTLRKIAQCYTLRFLIEHANVEIRKFNSRYELQQVKHSLGIRVIDHDRADDVRDTTSLSGGETFIVSLGLALGLSSLSSRNIRFENLFIDEGFGTLDPDTLATVIDALAMLQSSQGKKVGVISHTDTMSERITTQIRIIKNGNSGSSHIEIYP